MKSSKLRKLGWTKKKTDEGWIATLCNDLTIIAEVEYLRPFRRCYIFVHDESFKANADFVRVINKEIGRKVEIIIKDLT